MISVTNSTNKIQFIDFEYIGYSTIAYDISNFFCECIGFLPYNINNFPDKNIRMKF